MEKGICRLCIVPVRKEPSDKSEMVTQLLFGDHYSVLEISPDRKWFRICIFDDEYEGWIDAKQHKQISEEYFDEINANEFRISTDLITTILYKKKPLQIVLGSVLPLAHTELFDIEEQFAFNGESKRIGQRREYDFLKSVAFKYLNAPYLWGGKSPFGIDCSGFTQMVFKIAGYKLKRDTTQQVQQGDEIAVRGDAQPGDLVFFHNEGGTISHVGILLEDQKIIHASGYVRVDFLDESGIFNASKNMHTHKMAKIKRILR
jgi:gamma-D-glutamyl-L-lysine dipeptidyl-peptidase